MFIRFVTDAVDEDTGHRMGIFQAAYELMERPDCEAVLRDRLQVLIDWFNEHLAEPLRFTRRRVATGKPSPDVALSWFKPSSTAHIAMARDVVRVLEGEGIRVTMLKEAKVGYVTHEDAHQVVAIPFRETAP